MTAIQKTLRFEKDLPIVNPTGHREHWFGRKLKASYLKIEIFIATYAINRESGTFA